jgi:UPF0176 protein
MIPLKRRKEMTLKEPYFVLAYYLFCELQDPRGEVESHKKFLGALDATARIYISEEGINGQLSLPKEQAIRYIDWMHSKAPFKDIEFKVHEWHEQAFPRLTIKYRKHLVARDREVNIQNQGEHVSPENWKKMLETEKDALLLDVRNDYEWKVGHFEGASLPLALTLELLKSMQKILKIALIPKAKK